MVASARDRVSHSRIEHKSERAAAAQNTLAMICLLLVTAARRPPVLGVGLRVQESEICRSPKYVGNDLPFAGS